MIRSAFQTGIAAMAVMAMAPTAAPAQSVNANAPGTVVAALDSAGLSGQMRNAAGAPPIIETDIEGVKFLIMFNNCADGQSCQDLQLRASFAATGITADMLNSWNRQTFVGKAYLSTDGNVVLEHPSIGVDGMSRYAFERSLIGWNSALTGFRATFNASE